MRVICIDDKPRPNEFTGTGPVEGSIYTVIGQEMGYGTDGSWSPCYELAELSGLYLLYDTDRFIPLSSIDETTFERNYNKQTV